MFSGSVTGIGLLPSRCMSSPQGCWFIGHSHSHCLAWCFLRFFKQGRSTSRRGLLGLEPRTRLLPSWETGPAILSGYTLRGKEPACQLFAPQNLKDGVFCQAIFPQVFIVLTWTEIMHCAIAVIKPSMTVFQPMHLCLNQWTNDQIHNF